MATRALVNKLAARIEIIASSGRDRRQVYLWRDPGEVEDEALERHYLAHPEDRGAKVLLFSWASGPL